MELLKILAKRGELVPLVEKVQLIFRTMRVCVCVNVVCRLSVCVWCLSPPSLSVCVYGVYLPLLSLCVCMVSLSPFSLCVCVCVCRQRRRSSNRESRRSRKKRLIQKLQNKLASRLIVHTCAPIHSVSAHFLRRHAASEIAWVCFSSAGVFIPERSLQGFVCVCSRYIQRLSCV